MSGFILGLMAVVAVLASILLVFVVLLQEPKGGGLASALGGSGMEAIGPSVGNVNRFTSWIAGVWMLLCFLHASWMEQTPMPVVKEKEKPAESGDKGAGGGEKPAENGGGGGGEKTTEPPKEPPK